MWLVYAVVAALDLNRTRQLAGASLQMDCEHLVSVKGSFVMPQPIAKKQEHRYFTGSSAEHVKSPGERRSDLWFFCSGAGLPRAQSTAAQGGGSRSESSDVECTVCSEARGAGAAGNVEEHRPNARVLKVHEATQSATRGIHQNL
eukprot:6209008-Pleurochrysis_carterae.AAC.4